AAPVYRRRRGPGAHLDRLQRKPGHFDLIHTQNDGSRRRRHTISHKTPWRDMGCAILSQHRSDDRNRTEHRQRTSVLLAREHGAGRTNMMSRRWANAWLYVGCMLVVCAVTMAAQSAQTLRIVPITRDTQVLVSF